MDTIERFAPATLRTHFSGLVATAIRALLNGRPAPEALGHASADRTQGNGGYGIYQMRVKLSSDLNTYRVLVACADAPICVGQLPKPDAGQPSQAAMVFAFRAITEGGGDLWSVLDAIDALPEAEYRRVVEQAKLLDLFAAENFTPIDRHFGEPLEA